MANNEHPYERVTPDEIVEEAAERVPEKQRDEARQLHRSLEEQWEPQRERYEMARLLATMLLCTFSAVILLSGVMMVVLLVLSAMNANIGPDEMDLVSDFVRDLLPYIATPLGVAIGFYFREVHYEAL